MREWLEGAGVDFVEYDVEADPSRARSLAGARGGPAHRAGAGRGRRGRPGRLAGARLRHRRRVRAIVASACAIRVRGVVQGVGFRPFVYRLARAEHARRLGAERGRGRRDPPRGGDAAARRVRARPRRRAAGRRGDRGDRRRPRPNRRASPTSAFARAARVRCADGADLAGPAGLRRLPARSSSILRDRRYRLSVHQLHRTAVRATRSSCACRTTAQRRRCATGRSTRPARASTTIRRPALPRAAGGVPGVRPATTRCVRCRRRTDGDVVRGDAAVRAAARRAARGRDPGGQGHRRLPPGVRRRERGRGRGACASGSSARRSHSR